MWIGKKHTAAVSSVLNVLLVVPTKLQGKLGCCFINGMGKSSCIGIDYHKIEQALFLM
jgi:hypothetical protein